MAYAWDEEDEELPPQREVVAALEAWRARLSNLYEQMVGWLPPGDSHRVHRSVVSRLEPMMTATGVGIMTFPALGIGWADVEAKGKTGITIVPEARWVVGTHGRVQVQSPRGILYLIDAGTDEAPAWRIYPRRHPYVSVPFTRDEFLAILAELP